jgi:thioredoxin reductase (NADPH)
LRNTQCTKADGSDLLQNIYISNSLTWEATELAVNWLFFAIWHIPNTDFLWWQLALDDAKYIITTKWTTETSVPWVFAAGDVQDHVYRQAITSAGTGCMAALEAEKYISQTE